MSESVIVTAIVLIVFTFFGILSHKAEKEVERQSTKKNDSGHK